MNFGNDKFSVLIVVYEKNSPDFFSLAINSLIEQSISPNEIIIVKNGPLTSALDDLISTYLSTHPNIFKLVHTPKNMGLGKALNEGIKLCKNNLVARMDADDICDYMRFEKQIAYMKKSPNISVLGCNIEEFENNIGDKKTSRILPSDHKSLINFSIYRNPLNHPTVIFKKQSIIDVGLYEDVRYFEDYFLWLKIINNGGIIANMSERLLYFRADSSMFSRRQGLKYAIYELKFLLKSYNRGYINVLHLLTNLAIKIPLRLLPVLALKKFYYLFLRSTKGSL